MNPIQRYAAGVVAALVPAVVGLTGNASFSQAVPVRSLSIGTDDPATHDVNDDRVSDAARRLRAAQTSPDAGDDRARRHGGHGADGPATDDGPAAGGHHSDGDDGGSGGHGSDG